MTPDGRRAEVVRFWETVERFNPQSVRKGRRVVDLAPHGPMPWDPAEVERRGQPAKGTIWRHAVYLGVYQVADVDRLLDRSFRVDGGSRQQRPARTALAAIDVSADGVALVETLVISSCAWAAGRLLHPGPGDPRWLRGFEDDEARLKQTAIGRLLAPAPDSDQSDEGLARPRLTWTSLADVRDELISGLGVAGTIRCGVIRVKTMQVRKRSARPDGHDFLNSFIANDLHMVAGRLDAGRYGPALADYLRHDDEIDPSTRIDVRERLDEVRVRTAPARVPLGRWPSSVDRPLAMGQQLAINSIWDRLRDSAGLFAVNGPPGTGKTTMLRDMVAAIVVDRARALSDLTDPSEAFDGRGEWRPDLRGFEIVVASSNNAAVQNVVDELPAADAVDARWPHDVPELVEVAEALLRLRDRDDRDDPDEDDDELAEEGEPAVKAWALIAARLGKMKNRHDFVSRFWFGDRDKPDDDGRTTKHRMEVILSDLRHPRRRRPWPESVTRFRAAWQRAESAANERSKVDEEIASLERVEQEARRCAHDANEMQRERAELMPRLALAESTYAQTQSAVAAATTAEQLHVRARPRSLGLPLPFGAAVARWREERDLLADATSRSRAARDAAKRDVARLDRSVCELSEKVEARQREQRDWLLTAEPLRRMRSDVQRRWGSAVPSPRWWHDDDHRERTALWNDEEWNEARSELFLAAIRLHRDFLAVAPHAFDESLKLAVDIIASEVSPQLQPRKALTAWRSLFFVIPVVSTTFASLGRLFGHLDAESLGWLLIDEAGQATPQNAIGGIWRSRRVVVVGDPMQLEPVVTLSAPAQQAIRAGHQVDERWLPGRTSVQRLADELTGVGTSIATTDGDVWVGAPLRVHRRCDEPMFSIVNEIAYARQMINGVEPREDSKLPGSHWLDVRGGAVEGNSIEEEHRVLRRMLDSLESKHRLDLSNVFVISPFRDVAEEFVHLPHLDRKVMETGTTHRSQGKERDVVILVLGGTEGARWWAADKPNLLNVAVSRARRRLYVIGDRGSWRRRRWFDVLADRLPADDPW